MRSKIVSVVKTVRQLLNIHKLSSDADIRRFLYSGIVASVLPVACCQK